MSAGALPKWLGFKLGEELYAIALESVLRVYHHPAVDGVSIEAQEGYPVFVVPATSVFIENSNSAGSNSSVFSNLNVQTKMNWVVVLKSDEASKIGFRVEKTFGPFIAEENVRDETVMHESMTLHIVRPIGGTYG